MHNVDARIVTLMFAQLVFYLGGVSDQIKLLDLRVIPQRHHGAGNKVRRTKVTAHRVEGDLHQCKTLRTLVAECKVKIVAASLREALVLSMRHLASLTERRLQSFAFERQHLSTAVITARWASDVRRDAASALGTLVQLRSMPTVRCFAHA